MELIIFHYIKDKNYYLIVAGFVKDGKNINLHILQIKIVNKYQYFYIWIFLSIFIVNYSYKPIPMTSSFEMK